MPQSQGWTLKLIGHICVHTEHTYVQAGHSFGYKAVFNDNFSF